MPITAAVVPGGEGKVRVYCTGLQLASNSTGLRCRFGTGVEVPAQQDGDGVSCCLGAEAESLWQDMVESTTVPVQVFHNGRVVAEESIGAEHLLLPERPRVGSSSQPGCLPPLEISDGCAAAATAAPGNVPPPDRGGGGDDGAAAAASVAGEDALALPRKETRKESMQRHYSALKPFVIISLSYLLFTTTDGAVRLIVLLHAYNAGFTAWEVALMFTLYELAGVVTNLAAGMMGAKWGIKWTLLAGLTLQLAGIGMLYGWKDSWSEPGQKIKGILYITFAQMLCGIAKDLTKLGGKTVTKLVTPDEQQGKLFKLVSFITGFKNSLKGVGYFIGAATLAYNYYFALGLLLVMILAAMPWAIIGLHSDLGRTRKENLTLRRIFQQNYNISVLSVSRFFLFGSRDMWFEVPLPFFLRNKLYGLGWSRPSTGAFLAVWIIVYGQVQSWTPQAVLGPLRQMPANKYAAVLWNTALTATPLFMALMIEASAIFTSHDVPAMTGTMIGGLGAFCLLFAVNSSIHSYLIVRYAEGDKVAMNVGFYYMANAVGRLTGTLVSGALYSYVGDTVVQGFAACFWASLVFCIMSALVEVFVRDNSSGLSCGPCLTIVRPDPNAPQGPAVAVEPE